MPEFEQLIDGCAPVPVTPNADSRGCLFEIYREEWDGAFPTVQWNACASNAGVLRGVHVHADYAEFYTLPRGRVFLALKDIRRESPTCGHVMTHDWSAADGIAFPVPPGVAHAVYFIEDSVLAFGLSGYWREEYDVLGCRFDALDPAIVWPFDTAERSSRDQTSGTLEDMITAYEGIRATLAAAE